MMRVYIILYTYTSILIVGFINISAEFIFKEQRLNEISENIFSSKITGVFNM